VCRVLKKVSSTEKESIITFYSTGLRIRIHCGDKKSFQLTAGKPLSYTTAQLQEYGYEEE
jgi:hypothetical protein